jgi:uncharacterized RDD family membrane protein YckC
MSTIAITTTQNIELEYDLASLGERIVARILDGLILVAYLLMILAIIGFSNVGGFITENVWIVFALALPYIFYDLVSEMLLNGQSVGKKVMGIKVISLDGGQASTSQYLIRWLFRLIDFTFSSSLLALIMVAATEKRQRLGDKVANTTLVKTKPRSSFQQTLFTPTAETNYVVSYPEVVNLRDSDMQLVKEVLINVQKTGNTMLAVQTMNKIEQVLNIMSKHEPTTFLYTILSDYNHLASKL